MNRSLIYCITGIGINILATGYVAIFNPSAGDKLMDIYMGTSSAMIGKYLYDQQTNASNSADIDDSDRDYKAKKKDES